VDASALQLAVTEACTGLAEQMAHDAEGATRVARVTVTGAATPQEAGRAARQVAESQLVKCSLHGGDPYWGRVVSELGSAGVGFDLERVSVAYGGTVVAAGGVAIEHDSAKVLEHLAGPEVEVTAHLGLGEGHATMVTTDLGPGYIEENMRTS
jgi:glutamate N-acetyltransferase/amino-acid N-acetyltransferase